jgi:hypothetical protein
MERIKLIEQLQKIRNSSVICYITGDRERFNTKIGDDVVSIFYRHLELMNYRDNIDLFLYTRGGDMITPIRLVKLIRSYCKKFGILIPYRAHSAGTLVALGADEIIMTKLGELTPVDPTTSHPFNPRDPVDPKKIIPISVEDINSYLLFACEKGKIKEENMSDIFENLTKHTYPDHRHLHPLALGNVYRSQRMIRMLSERLLALHMDFNDEKIKNKIKKIVNEITSDICIHNYPIYRDEAKKLGLKVTVPKEGLEKILWSIYEDYIEKMELNKKFNPLEILGSDNSKRIKYGAANIESLNAQDTFYYNVSMNKISVQQQPGMPPVASVNVNVENFTWEKVR